MRRFHARRGWVKLALLLVAGSITGCATLSDSPQLKQASAAYRQGNYQRSYALASSLARGDFGSGADRAAYLAGLSAEHLGHSDDAGFYLRQAARSDNKPLAGDAAAALGLLYAKEGRYQASVNALRQAANQLRGENQAHAYFYEAVSQQKLGFWAQARVNLVIARSKTNSATLRRQIDQQLAVTGYTVQTGAFADRAHAKKAAQTLAKEAENLQIGLPRLVSSTSPSGDHLTLVQIGQFSSFDSANHARHELRDDQAIVVPLAQ